MATGDGLLVRVKPPSGRLTATGARLIARGAAAHGNGVIELTGRASLQIRGLTVQSAALFASAAVQAGLACADPAAERRRTVIATPLADADPAVSPATSAVTAALETALALDHSLDRLPAKFGFLVDGGGTLPLVIALPAPGSPRRCASRDDGWSVRADIAIRVLDGFCEVSADGGVAVSRIPPNEAVPAAVRLAHAFLALAEEDGRRMRAVVAARGEAAVFDAACLACSAASRLEAGARQPIGFLATVAAFGAGLPFGSTTSPILAALADLAERFGDGTLRLTPWRAILFAGIQRPRADELHAALVDMGLIVHPEDPRLRVSACPGQPACASATAPTRNLAAALSPEPGMFVHVSGCQKGCAHPGPAAVTLVGREGRFDLVRHGRAGDAPVRRGLSDAEALAL
jgi:precorrin-3B synthase